MEARRQAEAKAKSSDPKAKGSEPSEPKAKGSEPSEPVSKASSSSSAPHEPQVKAMPNPYMSYQYCAEHSSVTIEEVSTSSECEQVAIPHPKRHQQFKAYDAAMKRQKKE